MATIGIDYGTRRVGIALSYSEELASPHSVLRNEGDPHDLATRIVELGEKLGADRFVLGVPKQAYRGAAIEKLESFAEILRQKSCKEVHLWNEAFSTVEADARRQERGAKRRNRKETIDMEAAAVILQSWLDERSAES
ncbi:MAG: Holliday junction resolvase RuvX [Acidobacteria bacterium]|nr:Holliday junction resolvase RuvX [Acidobacteriota bacterium]